MTEQPGDWLDETAKLLALDLPEVCREGVVANLELLARHARILDDHLLAGDEA